MFTFIIIMVSYSHIIIAIQRISSAEGRHKAFSMCASSLTAVILFYGSVTFSLHPAKLSVFLGTGEGLCCVLYIGDPHAKATDLFH